jgi:pilus assembly protein CpaB
MREDFKMNRRFMMALAASALFGLVAILIFQKILQNTMKDVGHRDQTQIVYAATKIPAGTTITQTQLKLAFQETQSLPEGRLLNAQDAVGKIAQVDIDPNLPITTKNTSSSDQAGTLLLELGKRAMSIRVDEATSVSGFARPGSYVDVGAVLSPGQNSKPVSKIIVQYLRVLATGRETQAKSEGQGRGGNTVTLEVTPAQAGMLTLAGREGSLYLILRHPADKDIGPVLPVVMGGMVEDNKTDVPRTATTSQPTPQIYPYWGNNPALTPTPKPSPTPTPSPSLKMASVRVIAGDKPSEIMVRQ